MRYSLITRKTVTVKQGRGATMKDESKILQRNQSNYQKK